MFLGMALLSEGLASDLTLLFLSCSFCLLKIITLEEFVQGFGSPNVIAVGVLFVLSKCVQDTKALDDMFRVMLGNPQTVKEAQVRLILPVLLVGSVLNNTPVVAMLIPIVRSWAGRCGFDVGRFMIPLSYAAIQESVEKERPSFWKEVGYLVLKRVL